MNKNKSSFTFSSVQLTLIEYLSAAIGAACRVIVQTLTGFAVSVQGAAGSRIIVARSPTADAVEILKLARGLRIVQRVWMMMRWKGRCGWRRRRKRINARGGRRTENRRRGRHTTVDLVQCSRHLGNFNLLFQHKKKKRKKTQVENKRKSHGSMSITHGQQQLRIELLLLERRSVTPSALFFLSQHRPKLIDGLETCSK